MKSITVPNMAAAIKQMSIVLGWKPCSKIDASQALKNRQAYADLIGVGQDAIFRWQKGTREPIGVNTLKVVYTAAMVGINIRDYPYHQLSDMAKSLGYILFFDLVDESLWKEELGLKDLSRLYDLALARSQGTTLPERQKILENAINAFQEEFQLKKAELKSAMLKLVVSDPAAVEQVRINDASMQPATITRLPELSTVPQPQPQTHEVGTLSQLEFDQVSAYVTLLLPLATRLSFDNSATGIKQKKLLRELLVGGKQALFPLSTIVNRLCNPRSTQD